MCRQIAPGVVNQMSPRSRTRGQVGQRAAQVAQAVGLADDVRVQRQAHHQRLAARLLEHLVEVVDDHRGEILGVHLARDDHRDVVELLRIGHRPAAAPLRVRMRIGWSSWHQLRV